MQSGSKRATAFLMLSMAISLLVLSACAPAGEQGTPTQGAALPTSGAAKVPEPSSALPMATVVVPAPTQAAPTAGGETSPTAGISPTSALTTSTATLAPLPTGTETTAASVPETGNSGSNVPSDSVTAFPDPNGFAWVPVVAGLTKPLDLADPADGSGRLLVLEQPGRIQVIKDGALQPEPFLDITAKVGSQGSEQGLLGIALHPDYVNNGYFYLNYTNRAGDTMIARYTVSADTPDRADPNSEQELLTVDQPYPNHNGGSMAFGPDGFLYMGLGDGGSGGDPQGNGQSLDTVLGKILRVDVNGGQPYAIPADNPFAGGGGKPEIWAYGLRNPWRFSFDRLSGDVWIADVGQNAWEEVDFLAAGSAGGANFGWNYREGLHEFRGSAPTDAQLTDPVYEYQHGIGCSVTGGFVYRGQALPEWRGIYLFSDFCTGRVWGLLPGANGDWQSQELFTTSYNVTSFGQDSQGEVYLIDQPSGTVLRLQRK